MYKDICYIYLARYHRLARGEERTKVLQRRSSLFAKLSWLAALGESFVS